MSVNWHEGVTLLKSCSIMGLPKETGWSRTVCTAFTTNFALRSITVISPKRGESSGAGFGKSYTIIIDVLYGSETRIYYRVSIKLLFVKDTKTKYGF